MDDLRSISFYWDDTLMRLLKSEHNRLRQQLRLEHSQLLTQLKSLLVQGLGMTFEHILGDYDEATELFSSLGEVITGFVDKTMDKWNNGALTGGFSNLFAIGNLKPGQLRGLSEWDILGITADN